ncbi:2,3-bisphosphoglycerate-independent phosphoglycerate mutase [Pelovirga terrestris]|uniref:2,3-bisphosphoglycerate-independent phosphoglycerate mutase n=1 Tax=Pelovirga terrestris TaxID=2771352 RepID=A0A8J6QYF3_9BACT|nr:2,3-bisphosphoglycerate-independent phosphoglycerate mutase [Pelovirga terrestris]MBD1401178.1 2,3-bisphosphoglycerate-independent phosphoglycerate mutase [Pelovirga terrestris]
MTPTLVALVILDGWGKNDSCVGNAVCQARTPVMDRLVAQWPHAHLSASGRDVGLPDGQMGNSEVGHLNIGAGRIVYQDLTRISLAIEDGSFFSNPALSAVCAQTAHSGKKLHLLGLVSDGGVHSHISHIDALVNMAGQAGVTQICIHAFMDGRDTPPSSGRGFLADLEQRLQQLGAGRIATVTGRYWAMDRDNRWDRVERAYRAMVEGVGTQVDSAEAAMEQAYAAGQTDEFVEPCIIGAPATIDDGDGVIFFNFRADRAREITRALTSVNFDSFERRKVPQLASYVCLTEYDETFNLPVAFATESYPAILADVLANAGLRQLRIAETEKYAHVTFFFNGGVERAWPGEDRVLIPSPQEVATYDQKPSMSAFELTDEMLKRVATGNYQFIVLNFANCDMVGHTGVLSAAIEAVETVDTCLGRVVDAVTAAGGALLITADHGNCEQMTDAGGQSHTAHTSNRVPLVLVDPQRPKQPLADGILADLAPTVIELLGLEQPPAMTGRSLLVDA